LTTEESLYLHSNREIVSWYALYKCFLYSSIHLKQF
jgi:hypothetical protein